MSGFFMPLYTCILVNVVSVFVRVSVTLSATFSHFQSFSANVYGHPSGKLLIILSKSLPKSVSGYLLVKDNVSAFTGFLETVT